MTEGGRGRLLLRSLGDCGGDWGGVSLVGRGTRTPSQEVLELERAWLA